MSASPENFDPLRRLLALKRHEQPPPGYFEHFSDKVIARIEAEGLTIHTSLWQRWFPDLDAKPLLVCAYGFVIVGLLVIGLGASSSSEPDPMTATSLGNPWFAGTPVPGAALAPTLSEPQPWVGPQTAASSFTPVVSSTAPKNLFEPGYWSQGYLPTAYPSR